MTNRTSTRKPSESPPAQLPGETESSIGIRQIKKIFTSRSLGMALICLLSSILIFCAADYWFNHLEQFLAASGVVFLGCCGTVISLKRDIEEHHSTEFCPFAGILLLLAFICAGAEVIQGLTHLGDQLPPELAYYQSQAQTPASHESSKQPEKKTESGASTR